MRDATAAEFGQVTSDAHVEKHMMYHGNARGRNTQTIEYRYCSVVVAVKVRTFYGNNLKGETFQVNPLFVGVPAAEGYDRHLGREKESPGTTSPGAW